VLLSNRALIIAAAVTIALTALAFWLWVRGVSPPPVRTLVTDDALVEVPPEVYRVGGSSFAPKGPTTVTAAEGLSVRLDCDGYKLQRPAVDGKAVFPEIPAPGCSLFLGPDDPTPFRPIFPGDDVRCSLDADGAVVWCEGSLAAKHAATVVAWSWGKGEVLVNGQSVGQVPVEGLRLPIGRHTIEFDGERARSRWPLTVKADEQIEVFFHAPTREGQVLSRRPESARMMPQKPKPARRALVTPLAVRVPEMPCPAPKTAPSPQRARSAASMPFSPSSPRWATAGRRLAHGRVAPSRSTCT
jgi:hypothetical protein